MFSYFFLGIDPWHLSARGVWTSHVRDLTHGPWLRNVPCGKNVLGLDCCRGVVDESGRSDEEGDRGPFWNRQMICHLACHDGR
jgi:hypothetical protein